MTRRKASPPPFVEVDRRPLSRTCKAVLKGGIPCWGPARLNGFCWSHRKEAK